MFCICCSCLIINEKSANEDFSNQIQVKDNLLAEANGEYTTIIIQYSLKQITNFQPINAFAIVTGVEDYPGFDHDLRYCEDDADDMEEFLQEKCNFKAENILKRTNAQATEASIKNRFSNIRSQIGEEDLFLFYFSGHGNDFFNMESVLPYDAIPISTKEFTDAELDSELDAMNCAQKYVILDSCYSGGMKPECNGAGRYLMLACGADESSYESAGLANGFFTEYVLKSFKYAADTNNDDMISIREQFEYAKLETSDYASGFNLTQNPTKYDGITGEEFLRPSIGKATYSIEKNNLTYEFYVNGHGLIKHVNVTLCSVEDNFVLKYIDISDKNSTNSGFGKYSGKAQLDEGTNITCWEMIAEVEGYTIKYVKLSYGDYDNDGLTDIFELEESYGTNPKSNDTDLDCLSDGEEIKIYKTNPIQNDTDSDFLTDAEEVYTYNTNPLVNDTDGDGYSDGAEILKYKTDPLDPDSYPKYIPPAIEHGNDNDDEEISQYQNFLFYGVIIGAIISIGIIFIILVIQSRKTPKLRKDLSVQTPPKMVMHAVQPRGNRKEINFCSNCGKSVVQNAKFCSNCGKALF